MGPFHRALAGIVRQLASRGNALSNGLNAGDAQMLRGLRIAAAALDRLTVSGGGAFGGASTYASISGPTYPSDDLHLARADQSLRGTFCSRRGFATGKDPEQELKIRTTQQILADLNLQRSDLRGTPAKTSERSGDDASSGEKEVLAGFTEWEGSSSSSSDDDDGSSSSGSSSSDSDDELSQENAEAARLWYPKFDEWYAKTQETVSPTPKLVSRFMYREDGERIDADSPLKVEEFWPTQDKFPRVDMPNVKLETHGELPAGEPSMEEMITKMDFEGVEGLPAYQEMIAIELWRKAETKRLARERELKKQLEQAASRVRTVDEFGRSHAVGKRKCSIARVWLKEGQGTFTINGLPHVDYFPQMDYRLSVLQPFFETSTLGQFDIMCRVNGGGLSGQSQAIRHGISKALQLFDPEMRPALRSAGLLTRDPRVVERKKPGKAKARKSFQWVKR
ncbi:mitochondrial ribosomal protein S9 precursor [Klebsormidium nitens]|uniref:Small ribosomal subunit protein uS9c n=1 Tax=Klebsormidium nitens TaxID=105231 RepID=A0A1Y1IP82_KLENI|nr:mitochondrial ribosomal protein S9 precursor [Klebsormidium nitens]|eukprot:GAQ90427.1 mitochondrial ribosomal protein S9 precursor [Klebsormidium nitens]